MPCMELSRAPSSGSSLSESLPSLLLESSSSASSDKIPNTETPTFREEVIIITTTDITKTLQVNLTTTTPIHTIIQGIITIDLIIIIQQKQHKYHTLKYIMFQIIVALTIISNVSPLRTQNNMQVYPEGISIFGLFFLFAIIGCCGYCYFRFCRGRGRNQSNNRGGGWFRDDSSDSSAYYQRRAPPPPPRPCQNYAPPPQMSRNCYNAPPPCRQAPYVSNDMTRAANQPNLAQIWQGPDHFAQKQLSQNCGFCNEYSRYGQQPRIMLNCTNHHAFHISCLNQHRIATRGMQMRGSTMCPVCSQTSQDRVRYFCQMCKQKYVWVDLNMFSDQQGVIDTTRLTGNYGDYCPSCRNM